MRQATGVRMARLALLAGLSLASAHAASSGPATGWAGTYAACGQADGNAWRLTPAQGQLSVDYRDSALEAWKPAGRAAVLSAAQLAALNATGSSRDPRDQAQGALIWSNAHFLRMQAGWFDRYRQPGQAFNPDLILTGSGQAVFLCKMP